MSEHFYTIRDVQEITGIPATALRFYDKRGLLVFVKRSSSGIRIFTDSDVEKIRMIQFLRNIDMPVNVISRFIGLMLQGDSTRNERRRMVEAQLTSLQEEAALLQEKIEAAQSLGQSLSVVSDKKFSASTPPKTLEYRKSLQNFSVVRLKNSEECEARSEEWWMGRIKLYSAPIPPFYISYLLSASLSSSFKMIVP